MAAWLSPEVLQPYIGAGADYAEEVLTLKLLASGCQTLRTIAKERSSH